MEADVGFQEDAHTGDTHGLQGVAVIGEEGETRRGNEGDHGCGEARFRVEEGGGNMEKVDEEVLTGRAVWRGGRFVHMKIHTPLNRTITGPLIIHLIDYLPISIRINARIHTHFLCHLLTNIKTMHSFPSLHNTYSLLNSSLW